MKKLLLIGNVGRDPERRYKADGESFVTFSLAVTSGFKDNKKTDWMEISCNGRIADNAEKYVKKGSQLFIEGNPGINAYIDKEGSHIATFRVVATSIEYLNSSNSSNADSESVEEPEVSDK